LRYFIEKADLKPTDRVLDVGCGLGRMAVPLTKYLSKEGSYEGFDIVAEGINWCQKKITSSYPNFHFQLADVYNEWYHPKGKYKTSEYKFPFERGSFDFIFLTSVFTHLLPEDMENYLQEISRMLKPNGKCLITFFIINEESLRHIEKKQAIFSFEFEKGIAKVEDITRPEAAVSYNEGAIRTLYKKYQLNIKEPIFYGSWCGRKEHLSFQDIIVAQKTTNT
jgi:ubiquinone/menaquinone biosynthesis C-methylase UbiE